MATLTALLITGIFYGLESRREQRLVDFTQELETQRQEESERVEADRRFETTLLENLRFVRQLAITAPTASKPFAGLHLENTHLGGMNLSKADFGGASLAGSFLVNTDLSDANLSNTDLSGANLANAVMTGAYIGNADLTNAQVSGTDMTGLSGIDRANLSDIWWCKDHPPKWPTGFLAPESGPILDSDFCKFLGP